MGDANAAPDCENPTDTLPPGDTPEEEASGLITPVPPPSGFDGSGLNGPEEGSGSSQPSLTQRRDPQPVPEIIDEFGNLVLSTPGSPEGLLRRRVVEDPPVEDPSPEPTFPETEEADPDPSTPVFERSWTEAYKGCPIWGPIFQLVTGPEPDPWPPGIRLQDEKMYEDGLLCIPSSLTGLIIRAHHSQAGHPGWSRLWPELGRWYRFADTKAAERCAQGIQKACEVCQACDPARDPFRSLLEATPVPPYLMDSVAVDLFAMPSVEFEGQTFDYMAVCVDRQSGWMVATPHLGKGLTAEKVAKAMYRQWDMFGIPSVVASDRGPQFASAWWHTLCAAFGVRRAYGQAYHHQANGRAEVAGQRIMNVLSKLVTDINEPEASWVSLLPKALRHLHDVPGESGLSPYEVVFGRQRPLQGLPYQPPLEAEDAVVFLDRMREVDKHVSAHLNSLHAKRWAQINAKRREPPPFAIGAKVWYRPEPHPGTDKLAPKWKRGVVTARVGRASYTIQLGPTVHREVHRSHLKPHVDDEFSTSPLPLFYFSEKPQPVAIGPDDWEVENIEDHKRNKRTGELEFLVRWKNWDPQDLQWQPWSNFFHINDEVVHYCDKHKIPLEIVTMFKNKQKEKSS